MVKKPKDKLLVTIVVDAGMAYDVEVGQAKVTIYNRSNVSLRFDVKELYDKETKKS